MHFDKTKNEKVSEPISAAKPHLTAKLNRNQPKSTHYPFLSSPQRFNHECTDNPGPGAYEQIRKERHTSDYHVVREHNQWGIAREFMWIVAKGREPFQMNDLWKANLGPGKYDQSQRRESKHSGWGKKARFNYEAEQKKVDVGPGWYGTLNNHKAQAACSAFNSKSSKSYMDTLIKHQLKLVKTKNNPELQFSSIEEEIQEAKRQGLNESIRQVETTNQKHKNHGSPVFVSKIARLPTCSPQKVGPGSYSLSSPLQKTKPRRVQTDANQEQVRSSLIRQHRSSKVVGPGPGAYEIRSGGLEQSRVTKRPALGVILKEARFKSSSLSDRNLELTSHGTTDRTCGLPTDKLATASHKLFQGEHASGSVYTMLRRIQGQREGHSRLQTEQPPQSK